MPGSSSPATSTASDGTNASSCSECNDGTEATATHGLEPPTSETRWSPSSEPPSTNPDEDETCAAPLVSERPAPLRLTGNTFAHDPTMLHFDGAFYRYWTGDDVPVAKSTDLVHWTNHTSVYSAYPNWVNTWKSEHPGNTFNFPWAPDAAYFGGKYHLYVSFSAFFGRNSSCITHLTTENPETGPWLDHGPVICSETRDDYNAIDADVGIDADGNAWLAFGSFWGGLFGFALDRDGNRKDTTLTHLAWAKEIEAPVLFYRCGYYYLIATWGLCCPGEGRSVNDLSYRVVVGRSKDIMGPYVDRDGVPMTDGGGTLLVQGDATYAAAGHSDVISHDGKMYHLYHAYRRRDAGAELRIVELPFDAEGWPIGGPP